MSATPPGGPSTVGGVIYQMLWCLFRISSAQLARAIQTEPSNFTQALFVVEPQGGAGDMQEWSATKLVATQVKSRSNGGTWSLQEIIKGVFPDLVRAVNLDASDPVYEFVTDGRIGDWQDVEQWFASLRHRDPTNVIREFSRKPTLSVGARLSNHEGAKTTFWTKSTYSEHELFSKIVNELASRLPGHDQRELEHRVFHLLAHFKFRGQVTRKYAEAEIDRYLRQVSDHIEAVPGKRAALLTALAVRATKGNAVLDLDELFGELDLRRIPTDDVTRLVRCSRAVLRSLLAKSQYDQSCHVQASFTDELTKVVGDVPVLVLTGRSGSGKSWHSYALADELAQRGDLVAHVQAASDAYTTLQRALQVLWNTVKGHDAQIPVDNMARRLPGPPPRRVLVVDDVRESAVAQALVRTSCDRLQIRLVLACRPEATPAPEDAVPGQLCVMQVPGFSPAELAAYLGARGIDRWERVPRDVRQILANPLLARLYCDSFSSDGWAPENEYALFQKYWQASLQDGAHLDRIADIELLYRLGRAVLAEERYPWRRSYVHQSVGGEEASRLSRAGWLVIEPDGSCFIWHDRLLNWLVAATLVEDVASGCKSPHELAAECVACANGDLSASGRSLGYVPMDVLWLLGSQGVEPETSAAVLLALEDSLMESALYTHHVPTLGNCAVPGLLDRLDVALDAADWRKAMDLALCLAKLADRAVTEKATSLLHSDEPGHQSIALQILRYQGEPGALERLWNLHVTAPSDPGQDLDRSLRLDAIAAAVRKEPLWIENRIAAATQDTNKLVDLVYLLGNLKDGSEIWHNCKSHLKAIVPAAKRRSLAYCIHKFADEEEQEFLESEGVREEDLTGPMALASLSRLDPVAAIAELAKSELRYLAFTRGWHVHPLLIAMPQEARDAIRSIVFKRDPGRELCMLYSGAENEIDPDEFDLVLDHLEEVLGSEVAKGTTPNSGSLYRLLAFVNGIYQPELLSRLSERRGTQLPGLLGRYLLSLGARETISVRLLDKPALRVLQRIGDPALQAIVKAWLRSDSWYGRIDGLGEAHKHSDKDIIGLLSRLALATPSDDRSWLESQLATHALSHLGEWDAVLQVVLQRGLAVSRYTLYQRDSEGPMDGRAIRRLLRRFRAGEESPGLLLGAGFSGNPVFAPFVRKALLRAEADQPTFLSAATAACLLRMSDSEIVAALVGRLDEEGLRERMLDLLLSLRTSDSLDAVASHLEARFDARVCAALGRSQMYRERAAGLAWRNRGSQRSSIGFSEVLPLMAALPEAQVYLYLERIAFGEITSVVDASLRAAAVETLGAFDASRAFEAARGALGDPVEKDRGRYAAILVTLNPERAVNELLRMMEMEQDQAVKVAIGDALQGQDIECELVSMLESLDARARKAACTLAWRRPLSEELECYLRRCALDNDEGVASAAIWAIRDSIRSRAVEALVQQVIDEPPGEHRWVLLDLIVESACASKSRPPLRPGPLKKLDGRLTALEARMINKELGEGRRKYDQEMRAAARRPSEE